MSSVQPNEGAQFSTGAGMQLDARGRESEGAERARKHVLLRARGRVRRRGERTHNPSVHCVCPLTGRGMER